MNTSNHNADRTIFVYAPNVRSYGGKTLIQSLVDLQDQNMVFVLNTHLTLNRLPKRLITADGSLLSQLKYERTFRHEVDKNAVVFCLGNKPPFVRLPCYTVTGLLSVFAIDIPDSVPMSLSRQIKSRIQIALNVGLKRNTDAFLARSIEMIDICRSKTGKQSIYFPFVTNNAPLQRSFDEPRSARDNMHFFYPADAMPHKNLANTVKAWSILSERGVNATLTVTVTKDELKQVSGKADIPQVQPVGYLDEQALSTQYQESDALLFPSLMESFPLPIIEARHYNLPIVSSERTFIREQVDPEETFDPLSPISIADAVQRMMGIYNNYANRPTVSELPALLRSLTQTA